MILSGLLNLILKLIKGLFSVLPTIPSVPDGLWNSIDKFLDLIFNSWNLFTFFIRPSTINLVLPIAIAITYFEEIYKGIMFIVKKIPFINIK